MLKIKMISYDDGYVRFHFISFHVQYGEAALIIATKQGDDHLVKRILEIEGVDINARDEVS
jgi:hypothetical protein